MAGNTVNLEFAGDSKKLAKASKDAEQAISGVGTEALKGSDDLTKAAKSSDDYTDRIGKLGAGISGMTDAVDSAGAAVQGLADIQQASFQQSQRLKRATLDVAQAQEDYNQALRDGKQSQIDSKQASVDLEQAQLDAVQAQQDYRDAVKEGGKGSIEAKQALLDLKQAGVDVTQAQEDAAQATRDGAQASLDATGATIDLADAQKEAHPPDMQKWADQIGMVTPLLSGLIGVTGLITAGQWAWNAAQLASPTTWIIAGIVALVAVIVLIATKTDWFQKAWRNSWKWIKDAASNVMDWFKKIPGWTTDIFGKVAKAITAPYKWAFNQISDAWNHTVGSLSWTVPGWIPGIGGNTISVPNLPKFHSGTGAGGVPGVPGSEQLAILQAGEGVTSRAGMVGGGGELVIRGDGSKLADAIIDLIKLAMQTRGGDPGALGIRFAR